MMNMRFWSIAIVLLQTALETIGQLIKDKQPTSSTFVQGLTECRDKLNKMVPAAESLNQDQDRGATRSEETFIPQENDRNTTGQEDSSEGL